MMNLIAAWRQCGVDAMLHRPAPIRWSISGAQGTLQGAVTLSVLPPRGAGVCGRGGGRPVQRGHRADVIG